MIHLHNGQVRLNTESKQIANIFTFLILAVVLIWIGFRYDQTLNQLHPEWCLLGILLGVAWCIRYGLYLPLFLLVLIFGILIKFWIFDLPKHSEWLQNLSLQQQRVLIQAKIRQRDVQNEQIILHLNSVEIFQKHERRWLPEIVIRFPKYKRNPSRFYRSRKLEIIGVPQSVHTDSQRLHLELKYIRYRNATPINSELSRFRESWILNLRNRAQFYLSDSALSLYLPLALAQKSYQTRSVSIIFQESGMAHLLAISGLHIGLIYGLLFGLLLLAGRVSTRFMHHPYFHHWCHGLTLIWIWAYLFLIGAPTPALRAVCMLSLLVFRYILGEAHFPLHALFCTALLFIFLNPAVIYEVSFQLSFLAVLYILWFLPLFPQSNANDAIWRRFGKYGLTSIGITSSVMLGTWPVVSSTFGRISLETFWLNLIMVILLAVIVLPCCLLSLMVSILSLNSLPFGFFERNIFALTEWVIEGWFQILQTIHGWGNWASFTFQLDWNTPGFLMYFGLTLWGGKLLVNHFKRNEWVRSG